MRNEPYSQGAMSFDCEMQEITILHTMNLNLDYNYKCSDESVSVLCATLQHINYFHNLMSNNKLNGKKHRQMWNIMHNIKGSWNMGGDNIAEEHQPRWDMDITPLGQNHLGKTILRQNPLPLMTMATTKHFTFFPTDLHPTSIPTLHASHVFTP